MMHISEAVKKYPQLVPLLKGEFDEKVWHDMIFYGATSRFLVGIPNPIVYFEADLEKPLTFEKEEEEGEPDTFIVGIKTIIYTIKNK